MTFSTFTRSAPLSAAARAVLHLPESAHRAPTFFSAGITPMRLRDDWAFIKPLPASPDSARHLAHVRQDTFLAIYKRSRIVTARHTS